MSEFKYAKNASKFHKAFGELLISLGYNAYNVQQEVQVKSLWDAHKGSQDKFDYYIPILNIVVEIHGQQHYTPATFGGISKNEARIKFVQQSLRDDEKRISALNAGIAYTFFKFDEKMTEELFYKKIREAKEELKDWLPTQLDTAYKKPVETKKEKNARLKAAREANKNFRNRGKTWKSIDF